MGSCVIVIPTYFAGKLLLNCTSSILKAVKSPTILIGVNDEGWLKASNRLIRSTTEDVILLNDDTIVLTDIVEEMQKLAYSDPLIGIVGGKSLTLDGQIITNYGIYVATDGNTAHKHYGQPRNSVKIENQKAVEGSLMYIKRELIEDIGVFDEKYGQGYRAEVAYCFTAREAGWKIVSCPTAEYVHLVSQTMGPLGVANDTHKLFMDDWGTKLKLGKV